MLLMPPPTVCADKICTGFGIIQDFYQTHKIVTKPRTRSLCCASCTLRCRCPAESQERMPNCTPAAIAPVQAEPTSCPPAPAPPPLRRNARTARQHLQFLFKLQILHRLPEVHSVDTAAFLPNHVHKHPSALASGGARAQYTGAAACILCLVSSVTASRLRRS